MAPTAAPTAVPTGMPATVPVAALQQRLAAGGTHAGADRCGPWRPGDRVPVGVSFRFVHVAHVHVLC